MWAELAATPACLEAGRVSANAVNTGLNPAGKIWIVDVRSQFYLTPTTVVDFHFNHLFERETFKWHASPSVPYSH